MNLAIKILFKEISRAFFEKDFRQFLKLAFKFSRYPRYTRKIVRFLNYLFIVPDTLSFIWQFKEIFTDKIYAFQTDSSCPIIYDCGANIGTSVAYFKKIFPNSKLKAFEANPQIAELLQRNITENNIKDVEIIKKAVWTNNDGIKLNLDEADSSSIYADGKKIKVESVRLKELIEKEESIALLKMDIEGAEVEVMKDCIEVIQKIENIIIEYHSFVNNKQNLDELLNLLSVNSFRYFIKSEAERIMPLINHINKNNPAMDLQISIFAYRNR